MKIRKKEERKEDLCEDEPEQGMSLQCLQAMKSVVVGRLEKICELTGKNIVTGTAHNTATGTAHNVKQQTFTKKKGKIKKPNKGSSQSPTFPVAVKLKVSHNRPRWSRWFRVG
jgi:hypothetical protein